MTSLDPSHFEFHIIFSERTGDIGAFSLRPAVAGHAPRFCQFLTDHLDDPLQASIIAFDGRLLFTAAPLSIRLRLEIPTSLYFDVRRLLDMDVRSRLPLGVCHDPLECAFPQTTYVHNEALSPGPRVYLRSLRDSI